MCTPKIYLASASPRRAELLTQIGVEFEVLRPGEFSVDEDVRGSATPETVALNLCAPMVEHPRRSRILCTDEFTRHHFLKAAA